MLYTNQQPLTITTAYAFENMTYDRIVVRGQIEPLMSTETGALCPWKSTADRTLVHGKSSRGYASGLRVSVRVRRPAASRLDARRSVNRMQTVEAGVGCLHRG